MKTKPTKVNRNRREKSTTVKKSSAITLRTGRLRTMGTSTGKMTRT